MNWTDEEIDKLFQESASQMNVPYQDAFWTEMETLLPKKEKKKGLGWIFGGTLTCFGLIAAMIFPVNHFSVSTAGKPAESNTNVIQFPTENKNTSVSITSLPSASGFSGAEETGNSTMQSPGAELKSGASQNAYKAKNIHHFTSGQKGTTSSADNLADFAQPDQSNPANQSLVAGKNPDDLNLAETRLSLLPLPSNAPQLENGSFAAIRPNPRSKQYYAQIGFGIAQSYISGANGNWMPALNLGAGYQFRPQGFGFSAGLNIQSTLSSNLEFTRRSKVYNFGSTNYEQNFKYKQLYSVELPVSVDFRKNRHVVSVGLAPTFLATTVMRFSQSENGELAENRSYIGQRTGMNSFGLKSSISYQMEINKSWYLGIQLSAQMIKQIDHTQFIGDYTKLPLNGQITIRKTIMR